MRPKVRSANGDLQELTAISVSRARYLARRAETEAELAALWRAGVEARSLEGLLRTIKALRAQVPDWKPPLPLGAVADLIARLG
jgi:hypothetical protein